MLATNALTGDIEPGLKRTLVPMKVFQAATDLLLDALQEKIPTGNPTVSDMRNDLRYFHYDRDNRLVSGSILTLWLNEAERGRAKVSRMLAKAFPAFGAAPAMPEYWHGIFGAVPDSGPRLYRLGPGLAFGGIYSDRGVVLSMSLGQELGRRTDAQMPLPVTTMKPVPVRPVVVQLANRLHPWRRVRNRRA